MSASSLSRGRDARGREASEKFAGSRFWLCGCRFPEHGECHFVPFELERLYYSGVHSMFERQVAAERKSFESETHSKHTKERV